MGQVKKTATYNIHCDLSTDSDCWSCVKMKHFHIVNTNKQCLCIIHWDKILKTERKRWEIKEININLVRTVFILDHICLLSFGICICRVPPFHVVCRFLSICLFKMWILVIVFLHKGCENIVKYSSDIIAFLWFIVSLISLWLCRLSAVWKAVAPTAP